MSANCSCSKNIYVNISNRPIPPHSFSISCTCFICKNIEVDVCCHNDKKYRDTCPCGGCAGYRNKYNISHDFVLSCSCNGCLKFKNDHIKAYKYTCCIISNPPNPECNCYGCNQYKEFPNQICQPYGKCQHSIDMVSMNQNFLDRVINDDKNVVSQVVPQVAVPQVAVPQVAVLQVAVPQVAVPQNVVPQNVMPQTQPISCCSHYHKVNVEKQP